MIRARSLCFALALALGAAGAVAARPSDAAACGGYGGHVVGPSADEKAVLATVNSFYDAVARGKLARALGDWSDGAEVVYTGDDGATTRSRPRAAIKRWIAKREGMSHVVRSYTVDAPSSTASVSLQVHWNGRTYDDTLSLVKVDGVWEIASKVATLAPDVGEALTAGSGYF